MSTETTVKLLDQQVLSVIGSEAVQGFEKAYLVANATGELKKLLTNEYMHPIMNLQGSRLGFRTDKDRSGGYAVEIVRNCLIEAVLMGLQPVGNQFNIIAGNTYPTKEGLGYLLSKVPNLWYRIIPKLPRINKDKTSAAIVMDISWSIDKSPKQESSIEIPIKVNSMMGTDAIIGKATRKARAWLYSTITGCEVTDGDIADLDRVENQVIDVQAVSETEETNRILKFIEEAKTELDLSNVKKSLTEELQVKFATELENRENEIIHAKATE